MNIDYYYSIDGAAQRGPVSKDQLRAMGLSPRALVWREGLPAWVEAQSVPELADLFFAAQAAPVSSATPVQSSGPVQTPAHSQGLQSLQSSLGPANAPLNYQQSMVPYAGNGQTNGMAVASMVLGIVGLMSMCMYGLGAIPSILAVIFGHVAKKQIAQTGEQGEGMATAGLIMGYIVVGLVAVVLVVLLLIVIIAGVGAAAR